MADQSKTHTLHPELNERDGARSAEGGDDLEEVIAGAGDGQKTNKKKAATQKDEGTYGDYKKEVIELIELTLSENASDLHFTAGYRPIIRVAGQLTPVTKKPTLSEVDVEGFLKSLANEEQYERFERDWELDFSYGYDNNRARFRCNAAIQRGTVAIAMRLIPQHILTFKELNLPPTLERFTTIKQGFFLCVGPVGQGKTTTLASMIDRINTERAEHIISIEDPIEYIFEPKQSFISQREVTIDTHDFNTALVHALRQDVNVIMVGEMRDTETIGSAVTAAETGHLVLSTLHTNNAAQTIDRIIDSFPAHQQDQIRQQLAASLAGVFSQRLLPRTSGGRIPAYELMLNNKATANLIRERRTHEINTVIETSAEEGMVSMNASLADLVRRGEIALEHAFQTALDPKDLERLL